MLITKQKSDLEMKNVINVKNINVFFSIVMLKNIGVILFSHI